MESKFEKDLLTRGAFSRRKQAFDLHVLALLPPDLFTNFYCSSHPLLSGSGVVYSLYFKI
jgi:hypothetical protein